MQFAETSGAVESLSNVNLGAPSEVLIFDYLFLNRDSGSR